jgi:hypothetical protein
VPDLPWLEIRAPRATLRKVHQELSAGKGMTNGNPCGERRR